ncbi:hypothetical protein PAMP_003987 [Pampus punctatissimus]
MNSLRLKELSNSDLYRRRQERPDSYGNLARDSFRVGPYNMAMTVIRRKDCVCFLLYTHPLTIVPQSLTAGSQ